MLKHWTAFAVVLGTAGAHRQYVEQIPNGAAFMPVWKAVGHVVPLPQATDTARGMSIANVRFPRNAFGHDFRAAGFRWTVELCEKDSDGDGLSNGQELGDPHCTWRPPKAWGSRTVAPAIMNTTMLSHPGVHGAPGQWANLVRHAHELDCRPGRGCSRLGSGPGIVEGSMQSRHSPPASEVAIYHYYIVPVILALGLLTYLCTPHAPPPRWGLVALETYLICHVGVFIGCHRWASHHAFVASTPLKWLLSALAAWCMQGTPAHWSFLHRLHHRFCDQGVLDLQAPRAPHWIFYGHYAWFTTPVEHFFMSSASNAEVPPPAPPLPAPCPRCAPTAPLQRVHAITISAALAASHTAANPPLFLRAHPQSQCTSPSVRALPARRASPPSSRLLAVARR